MRRSILAIAAICVLVSCADDDITGPGDGPLIESTPRVIILSAAASGPLADPAGLSFDDFVDAYHSIPQEDTLVIGLPVDGLPRAAPIEMELGFVTIDPDARTVEIDGRADHRGVELRFALVGSWDGSSPPGFALLIAVDSASLDAVVPAFAGTSLAHLSFDSAAVILSTSTWEIPASAPDLLQELAPGLDTIVAGVSFHGPFTPPVGLARALHLVPSIDSVRPVMRGEIGIDPAAILGAQGGAHALESLALAADLPVPAQPIGRMRVLAHTVGAALHGSAVALTLDSHVAFDIDGAEREFLFHTVIDPLHGGHLTLTGHLVPPWSAPFELEWLVLDSVALAVSGTASAREIAITAQAMLLDEFTADLTIEPETPELVLEVHGDIDAAELLRLANGAAGLEGAAAIELPDGGPMLRELDVTLRPLDETAPLVITAKGTLIGSVHADALLTLIEVDGELSPLFAFRMGPGLLGALVPQLDNTPVDDAIPGGTVVIPFLDGETTSIDRSELAPAAHAFFDSAFAGLDDWQLEVSSVLHLHAALPMSGLPAAAARVLAVDTAGSALLDGAIGGTLDLLAGPAGLQLDSIEISAQLPFAGASPILPSWLRTRSHEVHVRWSHASREFQLTSQLRAVFPDDSVDVVVELDLEAGGNEESVLLLGSAGEWRHPWGLHWLDVDSLALRIEGEPSAPHVDFDTELEIAGVPVLLDVHATEEGDVELRVEVVTALTLDSIAQVAGALGGVSAAVDVHLPAGPTLDSIVAIVHPSAQVPFTLTASGSLHGGDLDVAAMLTLVEVNDTLTPVMVLRTGETSLSRLVPGIGSGSPLDLDVPDLGIALPTVGAPVTIPSVDLPASARAFLAPIFGAGDFELRLESALRIDAPIALDIVPDGIARALALDVGDSAHIGGMLGVELDVLSGASPQIDSLRVYAELPRRGAPDTPGWPHWLEPRRDSIALFWSREPDVRRLDVLSLLVAQLDADSVELRMSADLAADSAREQTEIKGRSGPWSNAFGVDWIDVDSLGLRLTHDGASTTVEFGAELEVEGREADLDVLVTSGGVVELEIDVEMFLLENVVALLEERWPALQMPSGFPLDTLEDVFVYVRLGEAPGFSIGGVADFMDERATMLVSAARGTDGPVLLAGFAIAHFGLGDILDDVVDASVQPYLDALAFDTAAILYSNVDGEAATHTLDRHALEFYRMVFGEDAGGNDASIQLSQGISVVAQRQLPPGGSLDSILTATAPHSHDRTVRLAGTLPTSFISGTANGGNSHGLSLELLLPDMAPASPGWFRHGQLAVVLKASPISFGIEGIIGVTLDSLDVDFIVDADVTSTGTLGIHGSAAFDQGWVDPFGVSGITLRGLGLDLTLNAVSVGLCVGGDVSIGREDLRAAIGIDLNIETGVPTGGVLYAQSDRGILLDDLVALQDTMFDGGALSLSALPDMRLDTLELLIALPNPGTLRCLPQGTNDIFELQGNLWVELDPGAGMHKLASADIEVSRDGIIARGAIESGSIGPISWTRPLLDMALTLEDQHLDIHGAARLGDAIEIDSLALSLHRDSMSFATSIEVYDGFHASISAAANPSLTAPSFHVSGEIEGAYLDTLSVETERLLTDAVEDAEAFLVLIKSNRTGFDLDDAVADAKAARDAAEASWHSAQSTLSTLQTERSKCYWNVCKLRYGAEIDVIEGVIEARYLLFEAADKIHTDLKHVEVLITEVTSALGVVDVWLRDDSIELTRAGFHTDLQSLIAGHGVELYVTVSVNGDTRDVACDLDADLAGNVASIVSALLPAGFGVVPGY